MGSSVQHVGRFESRKEEPTLSNVVGFGKALAAPWNSRSTAEAD
jgi:hypothetical protein